MYLKQLCLKLEKFDVKTLKKHYQKNKVMGINHSCRLVLNKKNYSKNFNILFSFIFINYIKLKEYIWSCFRENRGNEVTSYFRWWDTD